MASLPPIMCEIRGGVRLGCCIPPILFNSYGKWLAKEALDAIGSFKVEVRVTETLKTSAEEKYTTDRLLGTGRNYENQ